MICFRSMLLVCPAVYVLAQTPAPVSRQATPIPAPAPPAAGQAAGSRTMQIPVVPPPPQVPPETVVLTIGDLQLTAAQFYTLADALPEAYREFVKGPGRRQFADQIARILALSGEALRRKLDQKPEFQLQSKYRNDELLATYEQAALNDDIQIDDTALREYYEAHKANYERVHARQILIRTQDSPAPLKPGARDLTDAEALAKARALVQRIKAGEDFAKIAAAESDDAGSASNFGDLGWFAKGQMPPTFEEVTFQLQPGQIGEPVKSQFGYHIFQVEGQEFKHLDEVKADIEKKIRAEKLQKAIADLLQSIKGDYNPAFFGAAKK